MIDKLICKSSLIDKNTQEMFKILFLKKIRQKIQDSKDLKPSYMMPPLIIEHSTEL